MPPKPRFTRDQIIDAALDLVRAEGISCLTARAVGLKLNSSARPIFTVFESMDEVQQEVVKSARRLYASYIHKGLTEELAFKGVGSQYILFAVNEPKLFHLLFMKEQSDVPNLSGVLPQIDESYELILQSVRDGYGLDEKSAQNLYRHLWIYTHGIAVLCATKMCKFTGEQLQVMLTEVFLGLLHTYSNSIGGNHD